MELMLAGCQLKLGLYRTSDGIPLLWLGSVLGRSYSGWIVPLLTGGERCILVNLGVPAFRAVLRLRLRIIQRLFKVCTVLWS